MPVTLLPRGVIVTFSALVSRGEPSGLTGCSRFAIHSPVSRARRSVETYRLIGQENPRMADHVPDRRVNDAELGVEHDDADRKRIEQIRGLEMGKYRGRVALKR